MNSEELPYPLRLVVETLNYCVWSNPITQDMRCSEILELLKAVYGDDLCAQAEKTLRGEKVP
jgi:hypothetical protein